ncbi:hypothetical protein IH992_22325 [Candidatus Poribacteria bacterium]|nr:hypothetical protein [Candidatus Poribacteria bacterium]
MYTLLINAVCDPDKAGRLIEEVRKTTKDLPTETIIAGGDVKHLASVYSTRSFSIKTVESEEFSHAWMKLFSEAKTEYFVCLDSRITLVNSGLVTDPEQTRDRAIRHAFKRFAEMKNPAKCNYSLAPYKQTLEYLIHLLKNSHASLVFPCLLIEELANIVFYHGIGFEKGIPIPKNVKSVYHQIRTASNLRWRREFAGCLSAFAVRAVAVKVNKHDFDEPHLFGMDLQLQVRGNGGLIYSTTDAAVWLSGKTPTPDSDLILASRERSIEDKFLERWQESELLAVESLYTEDRQIIQKFSVK